MQDSFEIKGYWFLPSQPENQIAGSLIYKPEEKMCLELIGAFEEPLDFLKREKEPAPIIHGIGQNGEKISLINCHGYGSVNFASPFAMSSYSLDYIISGIHLAHIDDKIFNIGKIGITNLTEWVNCYQLNYSISFKENRANSFKLSYDIDKRKSFVANIDKALSIELDYGCTPPSSTHTEDIRVTQSYLLKLLHVNAANLRHTIELAYRFKSFLSLASQEEVNFTNITLTNENEFHQLEDGRKLYHPIKIFFLQDEIEVPETKSKRDFLFQLNDITPDFEIIMSKWFSFDHEMLPIIRHMIDSVSKKKIFRSSDFLIVIQALEGFHTRFRIGTVNKPKILLIDRLKSLYDEFSTIKTIKDIQFDFECITNTRHYYSHFFFKKKKIAEGIELYQLTKELKKLLTCCILKETDFAIDKIDAFLKKHK